MNDSLLFFFFALGAVVASFVGVVAGRLHTGQSIISGRSRCDACGTTLEALSLIPILSYLFFRARSKCCRTKISIIAPITELLLGVLFVLSYQMLGLTEALVLLLLALSALLALVLYDFAHQILPARFLLVFLVLSGWYASVVAPTPSALGLTLIYAGACALVLALITLFSRGRAMGLADAPLVFGLGLLAGPLALSGFVYSFWIGASIGIVILLQRPRGTRMGVEVPFAPYLAAGFLLALFSGWNLFTLIGW